VRLHRILRPPLCESNETQRRVRTLMQRLGGAACPLLVQSEETAGRCPSQLSPEAPFETCHGRDEIDTTVAMVGYLPVYGW
jgi:hypothetical protein